MDKSIFSDITKPKYQQIYEYLRQEIEQDKLSAGQALPSKRSFATQLGVSLNTVEQAYSQLLGEGYLNSVERKGYFVASINNLMLSRNEPTRQQFAPRQEAIQYRYDFTIHRVETEGYPWPIIKRLGNEVLRDHASELLGPGDVKGHPFLREQIAAYLQQSRGFSPSPEQIIVGAGTEYLLQQLFLLLPEETCYALEDPGFPRIQKLCRDLKQTTYPLPVDDSGIRVDDLRQTPCNIVFLTPSHQFPTGIIYPVGRRLELLAWSMEQPGRYLIEDDYDSEFKYTTTPVPSLKSFDYGNRVIYFGNFSKVMAPSLRLSYMVLPKELITRFEEKSYWSCPVPTNTQLLVAKFMAQGHFQRHLNRMRKIYRDKREALVEAIQDKPMPVSISGADAGLHLILHLSTQASEEVLVASANAHGIGLSGLNSFSLLPKTTDHPSLMLGFSGISLGQIKPGIDRLFQAWREDRFI